MADLGSSRPWFVCAHICLEQVTVFLFGDKLKATLRLLLSIVLVLLCFQIYFFYQETNTNSAKDQMEGYLSA